MYVLDMGSRLWETFERRTQHTQARCGADHEWSDVVQEVVLPFGLKGRTMSALVPPFERGIAHQGKNVTSCLQSAWHLKKNTWSPHMMCKTCNEAKKTVQIDHICQSASNSSWCWTSSTGWQARTRYHVWRGNRRASWGGALLFVPRKGETMSLRPGLSW